MAHNEYVPCALCHKHLHRGEKETDTADENWRPIRAPRETVYYYGCQTCGSFLITQHDEKTYINEYDDDLRLKLSALLREESIRKRANKSEVGDWLQFRDAPYGPISWQHRVVRSRDLLDNWPATVGERLERALCSFVRMSTYVGEILRPISCRDNWFPVLFAKSAEEFDTLFQWLQDRRELEPRKDGYSVTLKGWERHAEITRRTGSPRDPAFVAMWFGKPSELSAPDRQEEMGGRFTTVFNPAINAAGVKASRGDTEKHNEYIMNRILGDIRLAPFVVADFTSHNSGVYYEAGFARGLGKEVIYTCPDDEWNKTHFDIKQVSQIIWRNEDQLREQLTEWIRATIGSGPYRIPAGEVKKD